MAVEALISLMKARASSLEMWWSLEVLWWREMPKWASAMLTYEVRFPRARIDRKSMRDAEW